VSTSRPTFRPSPPPPGCVHVPRDDARLVGSFATPELPGECLPLTKAIPRRANLRVPAMPAGDRGASFPPSTTKEETMKLGSGKRNQRSGAEADDMTASRLARRIGLCLPLAALGVLVFASASY